MKTVPRAVVYVGLCGTALAFEEYRLSNGIGLVRKVTNAPGIVAVCRAADLSKTDYLGVGRYSGSIGAELAFGLDINADMDFLLSIAWHTAALMKLRQHPNLVCPCFATESWDVISGIAENRVTFGVLDDVPRQVRGVKPQPITLKDIQWVDAVWDTALDLRAVDRSRRFGLAFNIAYTWNQTSDLRIAIANVWCGIEALFGDKADKPVTRRVIEKICSWLPSLRADEVEDSYTRRCDAVHGRWLESDVMDSVIKANEILRQSLLQCIDSDSVPLPDWSA
jgi:hypothetical protein